MATGNLNANALVAQVIALLQDHGFQDDGRTQEESVRVSTRASPVLGKTGGELATFGGRQRFAHPSGWKVTVGKRTVCVYRPDQSVPAENIATREIEALHQALLSRLGAPLPAPAPES